VLLMNDGINDDAPSNERRASWAESALLAFAKTTGLARESIGDKEDPFFIVSDLLADLAHWCDLRKLDLFVITRHAAEHYSVETGGSGRQFGATNDQS
jgi:hypothetical protein